MYSIINQFSMCRALIRVQFSFHNRPCMALVNELSVTFITKQNHGCYPCVHWSMQLILSEFSLIPTLRFLGCGKLGLTPWALVEEFPTPINLHVVLSMWGLLRPKHSRYLCCKIITIYLLKIWHGNIDIA